MTEETNKTPSNFIKNIVDADNESGKFDNRVHTRFPPEPNGYLHVGHAKSICLNFGLADQFGGKTNLRFDDTNPTKEEVEYVESIQEDIKWLGFEWDGLYFASDYFDQLYDWAVKLIKEGKAYVDELSAEEMREYRGTLTKPGKNSPYRDRPIEENLDLFERMKAGEFPDGAMVLRAKIDMSSPNINFRDPAMYRILHAHHHRTGDKWCIYPMYDWAHGQSDSIEGITHSICTLEFENNRPLYNWFVENLDIYAPQQIEFARLNLSYMMTSKRKLKQLVDTGVVSGWDDPRMPTISGMRRRGFTPKSIRNFCDMIGVARANSVVEYAMLEHALRDDLNQTAPRALGVLDPLKVVITNYPEGQVEEVEVPTETITEVKRGKKVQVERKFMPGYVLAKLKMTDDVYHLVKNTPKVSGFLGNNNKPQPITEKEAARYFGGVEEAKSAPKQQVSVEYEIGDSVKVLDGPFASFNGVVEEVNFEKNRLLVAVQIFGRSTPVELEFGQVEKV